MVIKLHHQGAIIGDELGEQADQEQGKKKPKRIIAAFFGHGKFSGDGGRPGKAAWRSVAGGKVDAGINDGVHQIADDLHDEAE